MPPPLRILSTEDDVYVRELLSEILEGEGYRVTFSSAQDVVSIMEDPPDLLLVDGRGQGNDSGWAFVERLKANPATATIPVLVLSGLGNATLPHLARLAELDTVLVHKPFNLDDLIDQVHRRLTGEPSESS